MNPNARPIDDALVNLGLGLIAALAGLFTILWTAAEVTSHLTGARVRGKGLATGLDVLNDPLSPVGQQPVAYWLIATAIVAVLGVLAWFAWRLIGLTHHRTARDPRRLAGIATSRDVRAAASPRALLRRAANLRPSLEEPRPEDVGYLLGRSRSHQVWSSVEDSMLILGPPRSGKGLHLVVNTILDAPGPVVTTSTRPDNLAATIDHRADRGPVAVFDPQRLAEGTPSGLRWSPPAASKAAGSGKAKPAPPSKPSSTPPPSTNAPQPTSTPGLSAPRSPPMPSRSCAALPEPRTGGATRSRP
jgi:type IV secretion system protein VirD4